MGCPQSVHKCQQMSGSERNTTDSSGKSTQLPSLFKICCFCGLQFAEPRGAARNVNMTILYMCPNGTIRYRALSERSSMYDQNLARP